MSLQSVDLLNPDTYLDGVPHNRFELLRREAPVFWHPEPDGGPGFWCLTKYEDVRHVSREATMFSSRHGGQITDLAAGDPRGSPDLLVNMDPPIHTLYRALIGQSFTPTSIARMEGFIQGEVTGLLDELVRRGSFEFMEDFCAKIPMAVILKLVGVPAGDQEQLRAWIIQILARDDPEFASSDAEVAATTGRFMEYAHALAAERRCQPRDDLLSRLMAAEVDGKKLSYAEFGMFFILLLAAGSHTTFLALGNAAFDLMAHAEQRSLLKANPELIPAAVEELLRFSPPLTHFRRTATCDVRIRGQNIRAGQKVVLWYASANRDEEVFESPHTFDAQRVRRDQLAFGYGPHFCLGNALARLTLRVALAQYLDQLSTLRLAAPAERLRSATFNGFKRMPVCVD